MEPAARECDVAPLDGFLRDCADEIERRASLDTQRRATLETGARAFSNALDAATPRSHELTGVPVADHLDHLTPGPLVTSLLAARHQLTWIPSPRTRDQGVERALSPLNDVLELGAVTCGLMLLAPNCNYPEHAHPPHEIYLPISGAGQWRYGGDTRFRELREDALVYNPPRALHAVRAGDEPLLAIYFLWA